ncbi:MAG TPA: phytoene desaturase, partial [Candidatus Hydrogenedentes bacterium]|nr:phytoene desaturase [Candidatus Hydrogenedentota bacterium]
MNRWTAAGFRFDTGPSLITMPWVFEELFAFAGVRMQDYLETAALAPVARYVYPDGTTFHYSTSMPELLPVIRGLEGNDRGFFEFMRLGARIYALSKDTFLRRPIGAPPDRKALGALRHAPVLRGWGNYQQTVNAYFRSAELRQLYGRYPTYVGSSPYRSPATLAIIPFIELVFGGWYIRGGLYRLVEALCGLLVARGVALRADS